VSSSTFWPSEAVRIDAVDHAFERGEEPVSEGPLVMPRRFDRVPTAELVEPYLGSFVYAFETSSFQITARTRAEWQAARSSTSRAA